MKILCDALPLAPDLTVYHVGPPLDLGPLPTLFYFALSGTDSLMLDPFNQPIQCLQGEKIRIFSMTLPAHEQGLSPTAAMGVWAEEMSRGIDRVTPFLNSAEQAVHGALKEGWIDPHRMGAAGLSRGAFIAAHLAAREPRFRSLLGFAPMTRLSSIKEFAFLQENRIAQSLDLERLAPLLADRHVRLYIGNEDTRVSTQSCFDFAMSLVRAKKSRTAHVELFIKPSIGQMGHGTAPEIFQEGARWMARHLQ